MGDKSKIAWTDSTWVTVTGCAPVSTACANCYARAITRRLQAFGQEKYAKGFDRVVCHDDLELLKGPISWKKPRMVFVNSMSDTFHKDVPFRFIDKLFAVMALSPKHTFQILTKRPERMFEYFSASYEEFCHRLNEASRLVHGADLGEDFPVVMPTQKHGMVPDVGWPLPNVWLGVTAENQKMADDRIPFLLRCPAAKRFISCEPLLSEINLGLAGIMPKQWGYGFRPVSDFIHQVIVGGESGVGDIRSMNLAWAYKLKNECQENGVSFFVKQLGSVWARKNNSTTFKGEETGEWPSGLRIQEVPL